MNSTKRVLAALALTGAALSMTGVAQADDGPLTVNRDESFNYYSETLGDSVNQGIANVISPQSVINGLGGGGLW
ncbi:hypothetical protein [Streptomyces sp. NPDC048361]|uniref:hypothetical protein n=1 Tax=Streptomyces sp. NPDC048361 TaxID=3154720 RepID=UPI0034155238